jgi:hypothetical protein
MIQLPPPVQKVLQDYLSQLTAAMPANIAGIYLTGSVSLGDYYSSKSDIDFITILNEDATNKQLQQLKHIHRSIEKKHHHPKFNGYYLNLAGLTSGRSSYPSFFMNRMHHERTFELGQLSLFELKHFSHHVYGIPVTELPINVAFENVARQLHENINSYWARWVHRHSCTGINRLLLILFPRLTEWGLLGVARQLYTLQAGAITSKLKAGNYCLQNLPAQFSNIISTAIETRVLNKTQLKPSLKRANDTLACMRFIISRFNEVYERR